MIRSTQRPRGCNCFIYGHENEKESICTVTYYGLRFHKHSSRPIYSISQIHLGKTIWWHRPHATSESISSFEFFSTLLSLQISVCGLVALF